MSSWSRWVWFCSLEISGGDQQEDGYDGDDHDDRDQNDHVGQYEEDDIALWQGKQLASTAVMEVLTKMVETRNDDKDDQELGCQDRYDLGLDRVAKC